MFWLEFSALRCGDVAEGSIVFDLVVVRVAEYTDVVAPCDVRSITSVTDDELGITVAWQRTCILIILIVLINLIVILEFDKFIDIGLGWSNANAGIPSDVSNASCTISSSSSSSSSTESISTSSFALETYLCSSL